MSLEQSKTHSLARAAVEYAGIPLQSFAPLSSVCQHLSGIHCYADNINRQVISEHYCTHTKGNIHQCIFDSDKPDARLIGIEYIVDEATFMSLDAEEKKFWHSHSYEVESGMLTVVSKAGVPNALIDTAERPVLQDFRRTFGKTVHTWQVDIHKDLPLGPPAFMMAFTKDGQVNPELAKQRDEALGISHEDKREQRKTWLEPAPGEYKVPEGADDWQHTGEGILLEVKKTKMKLD